MSEPDVAAGGWWARFGWPLVAAVSLLGFGATSDASVAVAVVCLKFGLDDLLGCGRRRGDGADRVARRVRAWFAASWGLWKASVVATVLMLATVTAFSWAGPAADPGRGAPVPGHFVTAGLIATVGLLATSAVTSVAVASALRHRRRVWVGRSENWILVLILTALSVDWAVFTVVLIAAAYLAGFQLPPKAEGPVAVVGLIGGGVAVLWTAEILAVRLAAVDPKDHGAPAVAVPS